MIFGPFSAPQLPEWSPLQVLALIGLAMVVCLYQGCFELSKWWHLRRQRRTAR